MDPLTQIAAIKADVIALKASVPPVNPTTNFVTSDVQAALDDLQATSAPATPAPTP